ncbi:MAG: leucine-rich repeat domain-containing protein [Planctomycetota bacterium]
MSAAEYPFQLAFPDAAAAAAASQELTAQSPRQALGAILRQLEGAASLWVRHEDQVVVGGAMLHDDIDAWAQQYDPGQHPTTASFWRAVEAIAARHGGAMLLDDPGAPHDGAPLAELDPELAGRVIAGEPGAAEAALAWLRAAGLATTTLLGGYLQVPWTAHELSLAPEPRLLPDLARLPWLRSLELRPRRADDLSGVGALVRLESLTLDAKALNRGQRVEDLSELAALQDLSRLDVHGSAVADLSPLAELGRLQRVFLAKTRVSDLAPLGKALGGLRELTLGETKLHDLTPLAAAGELEALDLRGTKVTDLGPLSGLRALRQLCLSGTRVADLGPLRGLLHLERLDLEGSKVRDLTPLAELRTLRRLDLNGTKVSDLAALGGLDRLEWLTLRRAPVADVTPLLQLTRLERLTLKGTQIDGEGLARLRAALPACTVVAP